MSGTDQNGRGGGRSAAAAWARQDLRARWRSLVVLGLLAGLTAGFAVATLSGARRSYSALDRLSARTNASDAVIFASQSGNVNPDFARLARRPEVKALAGWNLLFGELDGDPGGVLFAPSDGKWLGEIDKPVVLKGRMFDPAADDEMVIDDVMESVGDARLGQVFDMHLYLTTQIEGVGQKPQGPALRLKVVGVVRHVPEFLFTSAGIASPGVVTQHGDVPNVGIVENAFAQLRDPARDGPALQRDVNEIIGEGTPILDFRSVARRVETSTAVEGSALLLLALAVFAAGGVLVGQALSRSASVIGGDAGVLRAVGMTRREMTLGATLPHAMSALVAVAVCAVTALIASRWYPVGVAARLDPDRGVQVDWIVLASGIVILVVLVLGSVALVARRAATRPANRSAQGRSGLARWVRKNAPVSVGVGASMALESGGERTRVAVRPALVGAMVGVLGVTAALTINHGLRDTLANPARAGVAWDAIVRPGDTDFTVEGVKQSLLDRVRTAPNVVAAALVDREPIPVNGVGVPTFMFRAAGKPGTGEPIALTLTSGRAPSGASEGVIGPATGRELGVEVGDTVRVGAKRHQVKLVGEALFPSDVHAGFDQGLWLDPAGYQASAPPVDLESDSGPERMIAVRFADGVSIEAGTEKLGSALGDTVGAVETVEVPVELDNLRNVRTLPIVLAVFLAVLAIAATWHVLMTSARLRRREFAILRSLGLTKRGLRSVLNAQATTIGAAGLLVGIPLGIIVGRVAWSMVTGRVPLENVPPWPVIGIALLLPSVILIANLAALWPGRRVVRIHPGQVLRTE